MSLRNTKVYSITMPPELAHQAERLAKKEHRTMSELMREALRRYQQPSMLLDLSDLVRTLAPPPAALRAIREDAGRKDSAKLTMAQIDHEVAAVRKRSARSKINAAEK